MVGSPKHGACSLIGIGIGGNYNIRYLHGHTSESPHVCMLMQVHACLCQQQLYQWLTCISQSADQVDRAFTTHNGTCCNAVKGTAVTHLLQGSGCYDSAGYDCNHVRQARGFLYAPRMQVLLCFTLKQSILCKLPAQHTGCVHDYGCMHCCSWLCARAKVWEIGQWRDGAAL
jgi:hypothetical protein